MTTPSAPLRTGEHLIPTPKIGLGHFLPGATPLPPGIRGVSETYRGLIEVDEMRIPAYVKLVHPWEVFNEALGSVLCQLVGLPTPEPFLVVVERIDYPQSPFLTASNAPRCLAFASRAMPLQTLGRHLSLNARNALKELVSNWKDWSDVLVFDQWIANPDRHSGNILVGGPGEVYLIDHGLSFYRRNWSSEQLAAAISIVTARLWTEVLQEVITLPERIAAVPRTHAAAIKFAEIDAEAAALSTRVSQLLPPPQIQALVKFLDARCKTASAAICNVMGVPGLALGGES